jgi:hypothetical protein
LPNQSHAFNYKRQPRLDAANIVWVGVWIGLAQAQAGLQESLSLAQLTLVQAQFAKGAQLRGSFDRVAAM